MASLVFSSLALAQAACTNPSPLPSGYAAPCPVFSVSPASVSQTGTETLTATPQAGTDYIYTTAYYAKGSTWLPVTLTGNNAAPSYSSGPATGSLTPSILSTLPTGTNYVVLWDWLWDVTAQCYKGPGLNQCNTGVWRVQTFTLTQSSSGPAVSISPTTLTFPATQMGTTSPTQYATLTNTGNAVLDTSAAWTVTGDFSWGTGGNCGNSLAPGANCLISAKFTPTTAGIRTGTVSVIDNAPNSPQTVTLSGTGVSSNVTPTPSPTAISGGCTSGCNNYYVATTGSDSNVGTQASPWKTINYADTHIALGSAGTVVHVLAGSYTVSANLNTGGTGAARRVRWVSDTKWGALINSPTDSYGDYVSFEGFDWTNSVQDVKGSYALHTYGGWTNILQNRFRDIGTAVCEDTGMVAQLTGANKHYGGRIDGNLVYDYGIHTSGCNSAQGIYVEQRDTVVVNNIVGYIAAYGIHLYGDTCHDVVANNTVFNNGGHGFGGGIIVAFTSSYPNYQNLCGGADDYDTVTNNIAVNNGYYGIRTDSGSTGTHNYFFNNLVYGNAGTNWSLVNATHGGDSNLTESSTAATFVNYNGASAGASPGGDYHLTSTSQARDSGTTSCAVGVSNCTPTTDFDDKTRPQGSAIDIGVYEQ